MATYRRQLLCVMPFLLFNPIADAANAADEGVPELEAQTQDGGSEAANGEPVKLAQVNPTTEEITVFGQLSQYSALKSATPIMEVARSVSIITEQQIVERGALTVADTYTYSSGVTGNAYGFATRGDWVKVRGFEVPQYQDSLQSLFGYYNAARPDVYTLEQVEILKGPASVLYGKGTPGGMVNLVTKRPNEKAHHEVNVEGGSYDRQQLALDSTGTVTDSGEWLYRFVGVYRDAETQVDYVDDQTLVLAPSLTWQPTEASELTLLLNHTDTKSDIAEQFTPLVGTFTPAANGKYIDSSAYFGDPDFNKYDTTTNQITLLGETEFSSVWSGQVTARYSDSEANYNQAWPAFIGGDRYVYNTDGTLYEDGTVPRSFYRSDASSDQAAIDLRLRGNFSTGILEHETLFGSQYQNVTTDDDGYYLDALGYDYLNGTPDAIYGDTYWINLFNPEYGNVPPADLLNALYTDRPEGQTSDIGLYFNDQITVDNWHFLLGLRYDEVDTDTGYTSQRDDATSYSAGVLYRFDNGISPYVNYAQSFEPVLGTNGAGDALDPQEGEQVEIGLKYEASAFPGVFTLAYFDIEQSNLADPSSLPGDIEQQQGKAHVDGIEFGSRINVGDFDVELALSKLSTRDPEGYNLASVPDKQASTWFNYRPQAMLKGAHTGVGVRYIGSSYDGTDTYRTPSYTLVDLLLGYARDNWDFSLQLRNATDKEYLATCLGRGDCFFGEDRTVVGQLSMNF